MAAAENATEIVTGTGSVRAFALGVGRMVVTRCGVNRNQYLFPPNSEGRASAVQGVGAEALHTAAPMAAEPESACDRDVLLNPEKELSQCGLRCTCGAEDTVQMA